MALVVFFAYSLRTNLSVAIVAMIDNNSTQLNSTQLNSTKAAGEVASAASSSAMVSAWC